jgi:dienelactone hydrolase
MTALRQFDYEHDGLLLKGQIAVPEGPGPHPAVLVMHDALGLGEHVCRRARDLAGAGYVALATDMYGLGVRPPDPTEHGAHFAALQAEPAKLRGRVLAGYEAVRRLPQVDPARISAIGYCFGGQCVLELARSGAPAVSVVSFHGLLTTRLPAQPGAVKAKVLAITGALDPYAPAADVETFQKEMTEAGGDWQMTVYGRGWHAFTDPDVDPKIPGVKYDPLLARLSWSQATAFLEATLRPEGEG